MCRSANTLYWWHIVILESTGVSPCSDTFTWNPCLSWSNINEILSGRGLLFSGKKSTLGNNIIICRYLFYYIPLLCNGLLSGGTKPLSEPILTYQQSSHVTITSRHSRFQIFWYNLQKHSGENPRHCERVFIPDEFLFMYINLMSPLTLCHGTLWASIRVMACRLI